ncbi:hypothetical protein PYCC9005_001562 [Savitreella phatthalungensis]
MLFSHLLTTAAMVAVASAGPVQKRQTAAPSDADILNYALTLEHLENNFYKGILSRYSEQDFINAGFAFPFYQNLQEISKDEQSHVTFLTTALSAAGATPVQACNYTFPYNNPGQAITLAKVLEGVGVSAYLGAAANITTPTYLTAAASILSVEARHTSYIRAGLKLSPFPGPYDSPLGFNSVFSLAAPFITGCSSAPGASPLNLKLNLQAHPQLTFTSSSQATSGQQATFTLRSALSGDTSKLYMAFVSGQAVVYQPAQVSGTTVTATVPGSMLDGQVYAILTRQTAGMIMDSFIAAGPAIVEIALPGAKPLPYGAK